MPAHNPSYSLSGWPAHRNLLALAMPMILANITTPLLGLVDTAVLGHMPTSAMLAGASIGALIVTQIYWVCGFLRMSATGLSAQARGTLAEPKQASTKVVVQTAAIGLILGMMIVLLQVPILSVGIALADANTQVTEYLTHYFQIRIWGAPAALLNLALVGWLVGQQRTKAVLIIQVVGNLLNAALDAWFVFGLGWSVAGVAAASVIAEYTMMAMMLWVVVRQCAGVKIEMAWFNSAARKVLLKLNGDMLVRNLALQLCLAFLTLQGARNGETATAVNAILMQFFVLVALGLDGVAYAVEALVGEAAGAKNHNAIIQQTRRGLIWSSLFALAYTFGFYFFGTQIVAMLTSIESLRLATNEYLWLMIWLPLLAHWCFLFDGVFVGLTHSAAMRNSMIMCAVGIFFPVWWVTQQAGNIALWYALLAFLLARGISLGVVFQRLSRRNALYNV